MKFKCLEYKQGDDSCEERDQGRAAEAHLRREDITGRRPHDEDRQVWDIERKPP